MASDAAITGDVAAPIETSGEPPTSGPPTTRSRRVVEFIREYMILVVTLILFIALSIASSPFLTGTNLLNLLDQAVPDGLLALALTFVTITGEFDLSVGALMILAGIIAAKIEPSVGVWPCLLLGVVAGVVLGLANGFLVTVVRINSFVCTLATGLMIGGLGLVITNGYLLPVSAPAFGVLAFKKLLGVQYAIWILVMFALVSGFVLSRTRFGRWIFAVGGNVEAARLSGINTMMVKATAFGISGLAGGLAGAILVSRNGEGQAGDGISDVLAAFAAVVVGGTSVAGGRGAIWRTVLGILFLGMITNGFNLLNVNPVYQQIVEGAIILAAVGLDALSRRGLA
ncbi:MAG: ABC transporter permease [Xanthobacteraceae bacterium]|nr:ABC transporter permease [Xanthobacteraceae bacterium]